ncbi:hypothetical protein GYMLUDRAFT_60685 [Collybiopsis luxurians FD-317 M1]|uniref:Uncharacterized protein n=1 Tax=Collybiopsis luxurians FD-317 M1 TaxID=944289 RepID=A0A0D0C861_9AGAR|nr:hypothetical protein GYMLUDRAFT_60685 [Collybiopsis luxurians FD-317 M1]
MSSKRKNKEVEAPEIQAKQSKAALQAALGAFSFPGQTLTMCSNTEDSSTIIEPTSANVAQNSSALKDYMVTLLKSAPSAESTDILLYFLPHDHCLNYFYLHKSLFLFPSGYHSKPKSSKDKDIILPSAESTGSYSKPKSFRDKGNNNSSSSKDERLWEANTKYSKPISPNLQLLSLQSKVLR